MDYVEGKVDYGGLKAFLMGKLKRELTHEEAGSVLSYSSVMSRNRSEACDLAQRSPIFAIAYMQYIMSPGLASYAGIYVYEVLIGNWDVEELIKKGGLPNR
jgi:hypothetical protein